MCDYQCTSVSFIKNCRIESKNRFVSVNRIESNYFFLESECSKQQ